mgnify:CR=1 FL=1
MKRTPATAEMDKGCIKKAQPIYKGTQKAMPENGEGETEGEDEEEDNAMMASVKKSAAAETVTEEELQKSLDKLQALAGEGSPVTRKDALLKKAQGEELSKSEKTELFRLLGGETETPAAPALAKSIQDNFEENDTLQKAVDVSDYLDENQKALLKSLTVLSDRIESDGTRQHEFNLVLAKAMSGVGKLVKGMSERLGVLETQPARAPKSRGVQPGQVLQKGFVGQAPSDELSAPQILDGLDGLMQKSMSAGRGGFSEGNENILNATARFESSRQISPSLLAEVKQHLNGAQH